MVNGCTIIAQILIGLLNSKETTVEFNSDTLLLATYYKNNPFNKKVKFCFDYCSFMTVRTFNNFVITKVIHVVLSLIRIHKNQH